MTSANSEPQPLSAPALPDVLTIYILFRNRNDQLAELLASIQAQKISLGGIFLSDNSSDKKQQQLSAETQKTLAAMGIPVLRRTPELPTVWAHIQTCLNECTTEYVCMMHDDDLLEPNFGVWLTDKLLNNPSELATHVAIAPNSFVTINGNKCGRLFRESKDLVISEKSTLLEKYFSFSKHVDIAPFPAYIYRTTALKSAVQHPLSLGIYSDVELLTRLLSLGTIKWMAESCFNYRIHGDNMSSYESFRDRLRILGWIKKNGTRDDLLTYRRWMLTFFIKKIVETSKNSRKKRYAASLFFYSFQEKPFQSVIFFTKLSYLFLDKIFVRTK